MYTTLNTNVKGEAVALGVKLGYMKPAVLAVSSVKALNSKEIEITFTKALNEGSAEDETNYEFKVGSYELASDEFEADLDKSNVVIVTLDTAIQAITSVNVTVFEDLLDDDLNELGADYKNVFIFYDDAAPEIVSTEVDSEVLTVTFSEFVETIGLVKVDGVAMVEGPDADDNYDLSEPVKELDINIEDLDLEDGKYSVTFANVADLQQEDTNVAGFLATTFIISDKDAAPVVTSVKQLSDYEIEIEFTKKLEGEPTVTVKNAGVEIQESISNDDGDDSVWIVTLDESLADDMYDDGNDAFNAAVTVTSYQAAVNKMYGSKYTTTIKLALDKTAPTLQAGKVADDYEFELRFNEEIKLVDQNSSLEAVQIDTKDILVVDEDGIKLSVDDFYVTPDTDGDMTTLTIEMNSDVSSGTFTITVAAGTVEDFSGNDNKAFTTTVKKSASEDEITVENKNEFNEVIGDDNIITIVFSDEMGSSALVAANYKLDGASLPAGTAIYFNPDKTTVEIELPSGSVKDSDPVVLAISEKVLGSDGEKVDADDRYLIVEGLDDNVKPVLKSAEKTNDTTVTLFFSEKLAAFSSDDFEVTINGVVVDILDYEIGAGDDADEVTLTVAEYNTSQTVVVEVVDNDVTADLADNMITVDTKVTATNN